MRTREQILDAVLDCGVIAIVRLADRERLLKTAEAIYEGGVRVIEFTLNTPGALDAIRSCRDAMGDAIIGAGTVLSAEDAEAALDAGAEIIVAPDTKAMVVETARGRGAVAIPGAYTPTEIARAMELGADLIKLFPAKGLGPEYVREVLAPLDGARLVPTGGVTVDNAGAYLEAGAAALAVGGGIVNNALVASGDFDAIARNARAYREAVLRARELEA
ncbi:MAG: bifunctional 4-hydroxy-2-oxoglutarate aldolase/2-dehydro-3-deoxy-phosphogluconate aldolase [Candidatus Hydrogenedentes bacterium]|nr:bifunctional 4-hydroxy-2-oxoglutarate aldolase/2-dehydro-3-deoxy-phosphogluconate aldolase [Candidatus Hydrogenedentota bacterium]